MRGAVWGLALGLTLVPAAMIVLSGQDASKYYTVLNPDKFTTDWRAFYARADALTAETRAALPHHLDLPYGADPKQRLDVYVPATKPTAAPVFIFIHGGGFREGDRAQYGYVARPLAARGVVTIVASYRLLPHVYPDQVEDTMLMIAWAHQNAAKYGGDPARVFVGGHSAGAILSALVAVTTDWQAARKLPADVVKGAVPVSGPYDLREGGGFVGDFLPDPTTRAKASPLLRIARTPPMVVAYGGQEPPYVVGSRAFVDALRAKGGSAELVGLEGATHDQTALTMADAASPLVAAALKLMGR
jgi:arylformamidase